MQMITMNNLHPSLRSLSAYSIAKIRSNGNKSTADGDCSYFSYLSFGLAKVNMFLATELGFNVTSPITQTGRGGLDSGPGFTLRQVSSPTSREFSLGPPVFGVDSHGPSSSSTSRQCYGRYPSPLLAPPQLQTSLTGSWGLDLRWRWTDVRVHRRCPESCI